jgi:hypothetical protein
MREDKMKTWKILMVLACGLAVIAADFPNDDPGPAARAVMPNGQPAIPPSFSWNDIFKGPR